mgnify:CR=1 FL=1|tara:strand:+ start:1549 stop:2142 length:594 start_codon:yes stop_codon:yes gene_type:complete
MIIIYHRINSIKQLKKIPYKYGVEIDIRDYKNELILNHDPFKKGDKFLEYLKHFKHKFLIINIKSEGIEKKIFDILKKKKINNFFFLDVSFPFIVKLYSKMSKKIALRVSDLESIQTVKKLKKKSNWIWFDYFKKDEMKLQNIKTLKKMKFQICYVSHDLQNRKIKKKEISFFKKNKLDMLIIKKEKINIWKKIFKH